MSSGLSIRGFVIFHGIVGQGFVELPAGTASLKTGDPVLSVMEITNPGDATAYFNGSPVVQVQAGVNNNSGFYLYQNAAGNDFSSRAFIAVIGVGPVS